MCIFVFLNSFWLFGSFFCSFLKTACHFILSIFLPVNFDNFVRRLLASALSFVLIFNPILLLAAEPLPIVVDGSTNTIVSKTASGIDQVNIATPNASGMSNNRFVDYNINSQGQVINNFSGLRASEIVGGAGATAVTQTGIAGFVAVNPNLARSGGAATILIQVSSNNNSQLLGYAEIAGSKANLIISNPNGIACNGCGFINTAELALIGGRSKFDANGMLIGFDLGAVDPARQYIIDNNEKKLVPVITIGQLGLDAASVSAAEIVARSVSLIGSVYDSRIVKNVDGTESVLKNKDLELAIKTGDDQYNYLTKQVNSKVASEVALPRNVVADDGQTVETIDELFAIDASNLSEVQAGRIFLVATKDGLGVNAGGKIIADKKIEIKSLGDIKYNLIESDESVKIDIAGAVLSIDANSKITSQNNLQLLANQIDNNGEIKAKNSIINAKKINNKGLIFAEEKLDIVAKNLVNDNHILAKKNLTIKSTEKIINNYNIISDAQLNLEAIEFENNNFIRGENIFIKIVKKLSNNFIILAIKNINLDGDDNWQLLNKELLRANQNIEIKNSELTNDDKIIANNNIYIDVKKILNNGDITASKKITLKSLDDLENNGKIESLLDEINIDVTDKIINLGFIKSQSDIILNASILENKARIYSLLDIKFSLREDLVNDGVIKALRWLEIAGSDLYNYGQIISDNSINLFGNALENRGLILANSNLDLNFNFVDNKNTKPDKSSTELSLGIISEKGNILLQTNSLNNKSGLIQASTKSSNSGKIDLKIKAIDIARRGYNIANTNRILLANSSSNSANDSQNSFINIDGEFNANGLLTLDLGDNDYFIEGEINSESLDILAKNITNLGNLNVSNHIKFIANNGYIKNGLILGDNTNIKLVAANYIDLIADGDIENYGLISSQRDLSVTSNFGSIKNSGNKAKISGGVGGLEISAINGDLYNMANASITGGSNAAGVIDTTSFAIINVKNLNNDGEIIVKNSLQIDAELGLKNNATALIWSGKNMDLNINRDLINDQASIYVEAGRLNIQNKSGGKIKQLINNSGEIISYGLDAKFNDDSDSVGNLNIKAELVDNKRSSYMVQGDEIRKTSGCNFHHHECHYDSSATRSFSGSNGKVSLIFSGKNIDIEADIFTNNGSNIFAKRDLTLNADRLDNYSYVFESYRKFEGDWWQGDETSNLNSLPKLDYAEVKVPGFIKSGGSMRGAIVRKIDNDKITQNSKIDDAAKKNQNINFSGVNLKKLLATGELNIDLSQIRDALEAAPDNGVINFGLFKINKNTNPNSPLIEARSAFTNFAEYSVSDDFLKLAGFSKDQWFDDLRSLDNNMQNASGGALNRNIRMLGDGFVEQQLLTEQLISLRKDALYLSENKSPQSNDDKAEIALLVSNSIDEIARLNLNFTEIAYNGLTQSQADLLQKDVVLFKMQVIGSELIMVPTIYLSLDSRDKLFNRQEISIGAGAVVRAKDGLAVRSSTYNSGSGSFASASTIFARESINFSASNADMVNNGNIIAGGNINVSAKNIINQSNSVSIATIQAGVNGGVVASDGSVQRGNLNLTAQNNILNIGGNIKAQNEVNLTAIDGDIINIAVVKTNDAKLLAQNSALLGEVFDVDNSVLNAYQLADKDKVSDKFIISSQLYGAEISGGAVSINAGGDFVNLAAKISASKNDLVGVDVASAAASASGASAVGSEFGTAVGFSAAVDVVSTGDVAIVAGDDVNISTLELRNRSEYKWGTSKKGGYDIVDKKVNLGSEVVAAGDLGLRATGLSENAEFSDRDPAGSNVTIKGSNLSAGSDLVINAVDDVNITSAVDTSYTESGFHKKGMTVKKTSLVINENSTNIESNIIAGNNVNINSGGDTFILASNLSGSGDANISAGKYLDQNINSATYNQEIYNADANVYILNGVDTKYHFEQHTKQKTGLNATNLATIVAVSGLAVVSGGGIFRFNGCSKCWSFSNGS